MYIFAATPLTDENTNRYLTFRTYRAEKTYAVSSGKWLVNIKTIYGLSTSIVTYFI